MELTGDFDRRDLKSIGPGKDQIAPHQPDVVFLKLEARIALEWDLPAIPRGGTRTSIQRWANRVETGIERYGLPLSDGRG